PDSFTFIANDGQADSAPATVNITVFPNTSQSLIDVDFGGGATTSEVGPAATGHSVTDFWNYYTRNGDFGEWRTLGALTNLKNVESTATGAGLIIANAPG